METSIDRARSARTREVCIDSANQSSGDLDPDTARSILSEMRGTPLRPSTTWDSEARDALAQFQRSEGLPPTGMLDDVTSARLEKRFEQFVGERHAKGADAVNKSPTAEAHGHVLHAVKEAVHAAENLAHQLGHDAPIRERYILEAKNWGNSILGAFERGELTEAEAAFLASRFRNAMLVEARGGLSPAGPALSKLLKEEGLTFPALMEKYAAKMYGKAVKDLSKEEVSAVCVRITERAGVTNPLVNSGSKLAPHVGKALIAVAIAVAVYQVATADDQIGEAIKQGAGFLGFWAGAKVGAAIGASACGPGAPACAVIGGLAGGVLGSLLAEAAAERGYNAIKG